MDIIIGTAGHIDHGKTSLVKALTGVDADRLPEEKERGITIDIGFAELDLGDIHVGFVDVPGHERFVKNMLAGASGIDMVVLVVAADEGVKPQTREHFEICRLLKIKTGFTVLTKCDLVDSETIALSRLDVEELVAGSFLEGSPIVEVSSKTGAGVADVLSSIREAAKRISPRDLDTVSRLPIDRSFSVKGFGAVVTGTLASGSIAVGQELEILPSGGKVRVRGLQSHGRSVDSVEAGKRVAVNLGGIDHSEISRGMTLCAGDSLVPTQMIDAKVQSVGASPTIKSRQRVRLHIGTSEILARVHILNEEGTLSSGESAYIQLRLESPVVAIPKERFILRSYSPQTTIAGGEVLDNSPDKHKKKELFDAIQTLQRLAGRENEQIETLLQISSEKGLTLDGLRSKTGKTKDHLRDVMGELTASGSVVAAGDAYLPKDTFDRLCARILDVLVDYHSREPLSKGIPTATLKEAVFRHLPDSHFMSVIRSLADKSLINSDKDTVRLSSHSAELSPDEKRCLDMLRSRYDKCGLEVPKIDELLSETSSAAKLKPEQVRKIFQMLIDSGELLKVSEEFYFRSESIEKLTSLLLEYASSSKDRIIDVPTFKSVAGLSRKYSIPLLEYFDRERVTRRAGDKRVIL